jgi:exonuclease III
MRIVTWNACKGQFTNKAHYLDHLHADVAVIQEIARPTEQQPNVLWFGENPNQGMAIVTRPPYFPRQVLQIEDVPRYVIPVEIVGPEPFLLFAVWTLGQQPFPYVCAASKAIDLYESWFSARDVLMLGDFNSNAIWDKSHPTALNHSAMLNRLERLGLVSAYHHFKGEQHGAESANTFYLHWNESKTYHIDYCFLPKSWVARVRSVDVGSYAAWRRASDHRPLLVELADA